MAFSVGGSLRSCIDRLGYKYSLWLLIQSVGLIVTLLRVEIYIYIYNANGKLIHVKK